MVEKGARINLALPETGGRRTLKIKQQERNGPEDSKGFRERRF